MKASLAGLESHRRLHPHPRVTAVAKKTATAAPLALSRKRARDLQKKALAVFAAPGADLTPGPFPKGKGSKVKRGLPSRELKMGAGSSYARGIGG
jgi:hypothetical protein